MLYRFRSLRRSLVVAALGMAGLCFAGPASAQVSDSDARVHFEAGVSYFKIGQYDDALREFRAAYTLSPPDKKPLLLLNIASTHERNGDLEKAVETLRQYLKDRPNAPDKDVIELRIKNLLKRIEKKKSAGTPPPSGKEDSQGQTEQQQPKKDDSTASSTHEQSNEQGGGTLSASTDEASAGNKTLAYVVLGVAGTAAVGAVVTGLMAQSAYNERKDGCAQTAEGCSDDDVAPVRTMAWVSTGLTGVAVVGAGVGMYMLFSGGSTQEQQAATGWSSPRLQAAVGKDGASVQAMWKF